MFEAGKDQLLEWKLVGYLAIICHDDPTTGGRQPVPTKQLQQ
jgi:hypothetical protein